VHCYRTQCISHDVAYTVYLSWYMASAAEDANLVEAVEAWLGLKDISDECVASKGAV